MSRRRGRAARPLWRKVLDAAVFFGLAAAIFHWLGSTGLVEIEDGPVRVVDGDTLKRDKVSIRLHGIDAPERRQTCRDETGRDWACGREATDALRSLVGSRDASCTAITRDRYGRSVARCLVDRLDLSAEMVRGGWALAYRRHSLDYAAEEDGARLAKRGIWSGSFERPEAYRARIRLQRGDITGMDFDEDD